MVFGLYHMFVASKKVTNTEHSHDAHLLLWRMVTYLHNTLVRHRSKLYSSTALPIPHIPNVSTFEGVLDATLTLSQLSQGWSGLIFLTHLIQDMGPRQLMMDGWQPWCPRQYLSGLFLKPQIYIPYIPRDVWNSEEQCLRDVNVGAYGRIHPDFSLLQVLRLWVIFAHSVIKSTDLPLRCIWSVLAFTTDLPNQLLLCSNP
jgi:hypothetical protein